MLILCFVGQGGLNIPVPTLLNTNSRFAMFFRDLAALPMAFFLALVDITVRHAVVLDGRFMFENNKVKPCVFEGLRCEKKMRTFTKRSTIFVSLEAFPFSCL